jgi:hypothetical protein
VGEGAARERSRKARCRRDSRRGESEVEEGWDGKRCSRKGKMQQRASGAQTRFRHYLAVDAARIVQVLLALGLQWGSIC